MPSKTSLITISAFIVIQIIIFLIYSSFKNDCVKDCNNECNTSSKSQTIPPLSYKPVLVTASSAGLYTQLRNFIGSCILHEPERKILVYDLGLSSSQIIIPFPFDKYPPHVKNLNTTAWRPIVMVDALEKFSHIIYQDAGQELRNSLNDIDNTLLRDGYFYVVQEGELNQNNEKLVMCASGIQGYIRNSTAHKLVLVGDVISQ
jgi:hypothetical protein